jgi:hypothetical protein
MRAATSDKKARAVGRRGPVNTYAVIQEDDGGDAARVAGDCPLDAVARAEMTRHDDGIGPILTRVGGRRVAGLCWGIRVLRQRPAPRASQRAVDGRSEMNIAMPLALLASAALLSLTPSGNIQAQQSNMTFFVTSVGPGKGGDLGGLAGADQHCQTLAQAVGRGQHTWRAYLSTNLAGGSVNARDGGPWRNANGDVIAQNVDDLHSANNNITQQIAITEKGERFPPKDIKPVLGSRPINIAQTCVRHAS